MKRHSFSDRARESDTPEVRARVEKILTAKLEARLFRWTEHGGFEDRAGIDVNVLLPNRKSIGVDVKHNRWGEVRVEYVSRQGEGIAGWAIDDTKQTDYVLNLWPKYFWLIDFPQLKAAAKAMKDKYIEWYGPKDAHSIGTQGAEWQTRFVPVPVGRLMTDIFATGAPVGVHLGAPVGTPLTAERKCPSCQQMHPVGTSCAGGAFPYGQAEVYE